MANPSLQIGNSNWAIKEDNLLGYSTAGTRFVPQPITMTRASAGTRVNPQGLIETVELLGSEEITNGDFASDLTGWSDYGTASATGGVATIGASANSGIFQDVLTNGLTYSVTINVTSYDGVGNAQVANNNGNVIYTITTTGIQTFTFTHSIASGNLLIRGLSNALFSLSSVSVKESTKNDLARVDYDGTASSLLVEPQRTNLIPYSEDFSQSTWIASNQTVSLSEVLSPNGTSFSYKLTATANYSKIREDLVLNATTTYTVSFYTKNISAANPRIVAYDQNNSVTLLTQSYGSELSNSEWVRITGTFTTTTAATIQLQICRDLMDSEEMLIWGAQLEEGSYATSYIPNFGTALGVTRVQDQYSKTGISNLINSTEGCVFGEGNFAESNSGGSYVYFVSLSDGTVNNRLEIRQTSGNVQFLWRVATYQSQIQTSGVDVGSNFKFAVSYSSANIKFYVNGNPIGTINTPTLWSANTLNRLAFDDGAGGNRLSGKVKQLQVFKTALTNSELATLTT